MCRKKHILVIFISFTVPLSIMLSQFYVSNGTHIFHTHFQAKMDGTCNYLNMDSLK